MGIKRRRRRRSRSGGFALFHERVIARLPACPPACFALLPRNGVMMVRLVRAVAFRPENAFACAYSLQNRPVHGRRDGGREGQAGSVSIARVGASVLCFSSWHLARSALTLCSLRQVRGRVTSSRLLRSLLLLLAPFVLLVNSFDFVKAPFLNPFLPCCMQQLYISRSADDCALHRSRQPGVEWTYSRIALKSTRSASFH